MRWKTGLILPLFPAIAAAQVMPTLSDAAPFTLALPYLEYMAAGSTTRNAFAINLKSTNLATFTLDAASVKTQTAFSNAVNAPQVSVSGTQFLLTIPYLNFTSGGVSKAFSLTFTTADFLTYSPLISSVTELTVLAAPSSVAVTNVSSRTVGSTTFSSSTKLSVSWKAPSGYTPNHYRIYASETVGNTNLSFTALATDTSASLTGLKSATTYTVVVKACKDSVCAQAGTAAAATGKTSEEVWQLQGTGNTTAGLSRFVSDGNTRISATLIGSDAGTSTAGRIQLYYGAFINPGEQLGLTTALTGSVASANTPSSYLSFTSSGKTTGLIAPVTAAPLVQYINTGQGVALSAALGGKIRLFFEAQGSDGKTRVLTIDSVDGYVGQDFNSGSPTTCSTTTDYSTGGGCALTVAIGLDGDSVASNKKIQNARQLKVGFPTMTDWRWDGAPGTFMVFTVDDISGCTPYFMNHAYAVWNGANWVVQYASNGCPKLFKSAQAAFPMHLGGVRYKLYYGDPSITTGKVSGTTGFLGPKKIIYADGALSASTSTVDFEDWESQTLARDVVFLWPNGDQLGDTVEGYIDDYHFLAPTGSLDLQVLYMGITDGTHIKFGASAVLLNP